MNAPLPNIPSFDAHTRALLLGALFHDIGKFEQRCTGNPDRKIHQDLGTRLVSSDLLGPLFQKITGEFFNDFLDIISGHHDKNAGGLTAIVRDADRVSASERVDRETRHDGATDWGHKHLASILGKIRLASTAQQPPRYYAHDLLTRTAFKSMLPVASSDLQTYKSHHFESFCTDISAVLECYESEADFNSVVNLVLVVLEKYLWCIPDFTGSSETDISLFNHLKDVAGLSHALHLGGNANRNLNLVIGDIPGIQNYIFDVVEKKPARILRGRSIFVQVLARNIAGTFLRHFGMTDCNLVMLAGGKFYIISHDGPEFENQFRQALSETESYLAETFDFELRLAAGRQRFNVDELRDHKTTFGEVIDLSTRAVIRSKNLSFCSLLYGGAKPKESAFVMQVDYAESETGILKCEVTGKPVKSERDNVLDGLTMDRQSALEYQLGKWVTENNLVVNLEDDNLSVKSVQGLDQFKADTSPARILINPRIADLLKHRTKKQIVRNAQFLEVANFVSKEGDDVMPFENIAAGSIGAPYLALIKGDIDNLGLIMACGLMASGTESQPDDDWTAISRTTTLSNQLKYFFSIFLNGFLDSWSRQRSGSGLTDGSIYTIFAGGDDLMIVCPQSAALELVDSLNKQFEIFACDNPEIHVSYSVTHFKDHAPIRLVAEIAEQNQTTIKTALKNRKDPGLAGTDSDYFESKSEKAGIYFEDSALKTRRIGEVVQLVNRLSGWVESAGNPVTTGMIMRTYELTKMMAEYRRTKKTDLLMWHPLLTYYVRRHLHKHAGSDPEIRTFFDNLLSVYKDKEARAIEEIFSPVLLSVILRTRK